MKTEPGKWQRADSFSSRAVNRVASHWGTRCHFPEIKFSRDRLPAARNMAVGQHREFVNVIQFCRVSQMNGRQTGDKIYRSIAKENMKTVFLRPTRLRLVQLNPKSQSWNNINATFQRTFSVQSNFYWHPISITHSHITFPGLSFLRRRCQAYATRLALPRQSTPAAEHINRQIRIKYKSK